MTCGASQVGRETLGEGGTDSRPCSSHRHGHGTGAAEHERDPASSSSPQGPSQSCAKTAAWAARPHAEAAESDQAPAGHAKVGLSLPREVRH